jgi:hypothetical protein
MTENTTCLMTENTDTLIGTVPAIFPRRRTQPLSEFRQLRRDRMVYLAGCRRDALQANR